MQTKYTHNQPPQAKDLLDASPWAGRYMFNICGTMKTIKALSISLIICMPILALGADNDRDGVDDSIDAFPSDAGGAVDTDGDGKPDVLLTHYPEELIADFESANEPDVYYVDPVLSGVSYTGGGSIYHDNWDDQWAYQAFLPSGTVIQIAAKKGPSEPLVSQPRIELNYLASGMATVGEDLGNGWQLHSYTVTQDTPSMWFNFLSGGGFNNGTGYMDNVRVLKPTNTSLIEDLDDDNDGTPDVSDNFPLDPRLQTGDEQLPLDDEYKGVHITNNQSSEP